MLSRGFISDMLSRAVGTLAALAQAGAGRRLAAPGAPWRLRPIRVRLPEAAGLLRPCLADLWSDRSGNVAIVSALAMPVLVGSMGLGVEVGFWYYRQQAMQNAADSAAVAAATAGSTSFDEEAQGVAARYGFTHGVNDVTVAAADDVTCPDGASGCYRVTLTSRVPLFLSSVVGYAGNMAASAGGPLPPRKRCSSLRRSPSGRTHPANTAFSRWVRTERSGTSSSMAEPSPN